MSMTRPIAVMAAVIALGMTGAVQCQEHAPITIPSLDENTVELQVLEAPAGLPRTELATVDGKVLTSADLLEQLLRTSLNEVAQVLLMTKMVELELSRNDMTVPDADVMAELEDLLPRIAPGRSLREIVESGVYSQDYLYRLAKMSRGWKMLFWKARNIPAERRGDDANKFLMQLFKSEVQSRYQMAIRGQNPGPPPGQVASLNTLVNGKRVSYVVSPADAMEFILGAVKPAQIIRARDEMIDDYLVKRAMQRAGVTVADAEVEAWARQMMEKYPPPFNWQTILRIKGTTPDRERVRWRRVQAWKRVNHIQIRDEDIQAFRKENEDYFRQRHVKVSHILCKFTDDLTGLSRGPEAEAAALEKARKIERLAKEGVDFKTLAQRFSDDTATAKGGGAMTQPIKRWGGGYDPAFQKAAYALKKGEISGPVRSAFGYHIILCNEEKAASQRPINWEDEQYADWLQEEYETHMMNAWLDKMRSEARITKVPDDVLLATKHIEFPK